MLILASVAVNGDPFRKSFAEESTGGLRAIVARLARGNRAIVCGCQFAGVIGDAED